MLRYLVILKSDDKQNGYLHVRPFVATATHIYTRTNSRDPVINTNLASESTSKFDHLLLHEIHNSAATELSRDGDGIQLTLF